MQIATFGAGCFWGVEETFRQVKGVISTEVGYSGGTQENPNYEQVCTAQTGHAEVVKIEFDPSVVSYDEILSVLWKIHNPTTLNRQGPDIGSQYRSVIFFHNSEQEKAALASRKNLKESHVYNSPIVTEIEPAATFYRAEEYHQQYFKKQGISHCSI